MDFMFDAMQQKLIKAFTVMVSSTSAKLIDIVPQILITVAVLIAGVIAAHVAYKIVLKLSNVIGLDKLAAKVNMDRVLKTIGIRRSISRILGLLVYWLIILFVLLLLSEVLQLGTASEAIGAIVGYIPHLIIGLLLLVVGLLIGRFFRDIVSTSLSRAGIAASMILGHLVQIIIVLFSCLLALRQIGFDVSVITTNIAVILAVALASTGLAVAIGLRPMLEHFFCARHIKQIISSGDRVEIDGVSGEVIKFSGTHVVLRTEHGEIAIPGRFFYDSRFIVQRKQ